MKNVLVILSLLLFNTSVFGQELVNKYDWKSKPNYTLNKELADDYSAMILLDYRIKEFHGGS